MSDDPAATWWQQNRFRTDTPLRRLIEGFEEIADSAIPYHWIPGRAEKLYAERFVVWADLAEETITSLLGWPKAGIGTVRALVTAAREAVALAQAPPFDDHTDAAAAVTRMLEQLDDYDRRLLSARRWALQPLTIRQTAEHLGVSPINVERHTPHAYQRFQHLLAQPVHAAVSRHAAQLSEHLGPLTEPTVAEQELKNLDLDLTTESGQLLLHVAGPYTPNGPWLERANTDALTQAEGVLAEAFALRGVLTTRDVTAELAPLGVPAPMAERILRSRPHLRRFADRWVRWGTTITDKAEAVLHVSAAPASADLIAATMGPDYHPHVIRHALFNDERFSRTTKQLWELRQWGLTEYGGIFAEFTNRIATNGGSHNVKALLRDMKLTFPDISEKSLVSYLGAPAFVTENGHVRLRTDADGWPTVSPPQTVRGVFLNGDNEIRLAITVDVDLLRGSGQTVHPAVATALGVDPGQERVFTGTPDPLTLFWRVSAVSGASLGSLRRLAEHLKSQLGDTLVLAFNRKHGTVEAHPCGANRPPRQRLHVLLGHAHGSPADELARALRCQPHEVADVLHQRGDTALAAMVAQLSVQGFLRHQSH